MFTSARINDDPLFFQHLLWFLGQPEIVIGGSVFLFVAALAITSTYWRKSWPNLAKPIHTNVPVLWVAGMVLWLLAGSFASFGLINAGLDRALHDAYYIVVYFHYILTLAAVFGFFAGWYAWFPRLSGRPYSKRAGTIHFWTTFAGAIIWFFPDYILGAFGGTPRNYADMPEAFARWNTIARLGSLIMFGSTLFFAVTVVRELFTARKR